MPTDNERREVARRLRACESHIDAAGWFWLNDELGGAHVMASSEERLKRGTALLADLIEPDDPPYNLYTLYEAVFHRSPRCWECIEDDEVDELVDALLDICNAPGHECIRRSEPAYPDATAIYKGWRAEVYDPDGALASPSNVAADLVMAHADGKGPSEPKVRCVAEVKVDGERLEQLVHDAAVELTGIDRDALLARRAERTCRNLNPPSCRDFECSECGESSEFTPGFMPNYCPHCGARVEEASDDADR